MNINVNCTRCGFIFQIDCPIKDADCPICISQGNEHTLELYAPNDELNKSLVEENKELKEKLHKRNTQIKDLKAEKEKIAIQLGYLTDHLLTVEEYHPDYLEDIKNNMI